MAWSPRDYEEAVCSSLPECAWDPASGAVLHQEACDCWQLHVLLVRLLNFVSSTLIVLHAHHPAEQDGSQ